MILSRFQSDNGDVAGGQRFRCFVDVDRLTSAAVVDGVTVTGRMDVKVTVEVVAASVTVMGAVGQMHWSIEISQ